VQQIDTNLPKTNTHLPGIGHRHRSCTSPHPATLEHPMWPTKHHLQLLPIRCGTRSTLVAAKTHHFLLPLLQQPLTRRQLQYYSFIPYSRYPSSPMDLLDWSPS
jgi:hypothetical protein